MDTIGLFQLENLMISRSPFVFLDLRLNFETPVPAQIAQYLSAATRVEPQSVAAHLKSLAVSKDRPVLLVSEDESGSRLVARELEAAGFTNVYIIAGGVAGLLSEL